MTPEETVMLTKYVRACCPQQRLDEYTPDAWHELLGDLTLDDARTAVVEIVKRQPFVSPAEIRTQVRVMRNDRVQNTPIEPPDHELTDDARRYMASLQHNISRLADGLALPPPSNRADPHEGITTRPLRDERRVRSLNVPCSWCKASPGKPCVNALDEPLKSAPAHDTRLVAAGLAQWSTGDYQRAIPLDAETS